MRKQKRATAKFARPNSSSLVKGKAQSKRVYQSLHTPPQPLIVRAKASAATARKLIATSQGPASITLATTLECSDYAPDVMVVPCKSRSIQIKCGVTLVP